MTVQGDQDVINAITLQRIADLCAELKDEVSEIKQTLGYERQDEYGKPIGTGVIGRLMRLELKVNGRFTFQDHWLATMGVTITIFIGVVWWLIKDRLDFLK